MKSIVLALGCIAMSTAAAAQDVMTVFGSEVYVSGAPGDQVLKLNGTDALSGGHIRISMIDVAGDVPVLIGDVGNGGNMCASVPFVVAFQGADPTVDVAPMDCFGLPPEIGEGEILFLVPTGPEAGSGLRWGPEVGFEPVEVAAVDLGSGWDAFRTRQVSSPSEMFDYADLLGDLKVVTGQSWGDYQRYAYGPSDGRYEGQAFIGSNCVARNCPFGGTLVIADLAAQDVFVAWHPTNGDEAQVRPAPEEWPDAYRQELEAWQAQW